MHVGHPVGYIGSDILSRFHRMRGYNVLHPMGWDAFGLPAEQYAITTGIHPAETTRAAIETYRGQLDAIGFSYDWTREIDHRPRLLSMDPVDLASGLELVVR